MVLLPVSDQGLLIILLCWNLAGFLLMLLDKRRARRKARRIRERTLFLWALLLGAAGIYAGMYILRHKTRHRSFVYGMPVLLTINVLWACYLFIQENH